MTGERNGTAERRNSTTARRANAAVRSGAVAILVLLLTACASAAGGSGAPDSFVRGATESQVARTIDVREGLSRAQAMRMLTESLAQRYTVEVTDAKAGFVMTSWQAPTRDGVPDLRYRTRVVARFVDDWKHLHVRDEANWARGQDWDLGYDTAQLDSVTAELRSILGRKP